MIVTEYDLPRQGSQPHDVVVDFEGMAWYADFGQQYMGRLEPRTAKVVEFPVPELKPGFTRGILTTDLDRDQNVWLGMMHQGGMAKFDRKTEKFQIFRLPKGTDTDVAQIAMVQARNYQVDGKVWSNNVGLRSVHRWDLQSGEVRTINPYKEYREKTTREQDPRPHSCYGVASDSKNNGYCMDVAGDFIVKIDAQTEKATYYPTPTPNSGPRRGWMDSQNRLWFAEYRGDNIGMFDTRTEQFKEWPVPTPWFGPYDAVLSKDGEAWTGGMASDRVLRLDPKSGRMTEYLLPRTTNIRRVFVDNSTSPVTFWVGNNQRGAIVKVEPLD